MNIRQRQYVYGGAWGLFALVVGYGSVLFTLPDELAQWSTETWRVAAWVYLSANSIPIAGTQVAGLSGFGKQYDLVAGTGVSPTIRAIPVLAVMLAAVLSTISIGYSTRPRHIFENSVVAGIGYFIATSALLFLSNARPGLAIILGIAAVITGAFWLGSRLLVGVAGGVPILGITSISGIVGIGLAAMLVIAVAVSTLLPLVGIALGGSLVGAGLVTVARNAPS
jgi:hypothetical protein